jgi:hypothetical protein
MTGLFSALTCEVPAMRPWQWLLYGLIGAGVLLALYTLDRLFLWMENRGWVYYRKTRGSGGGASGVLTTTQQFVEPQVQNVIEMREQSKEHNQRDEGQPSQVDEPTVPRPCVANLEQVTGDNEGRDRCGEEEQV